MATAFRIHEDIENVLDVVAQKKDQHQQIASNVIAGKINQQKYEKQPLRSTNLNNVNNDNSRNFAAVSNTQKTVSRQQQVLSFYSIFFYCWNSKNKCGLLLYKCPLASHDSNRYVKGLI